MPGPNGVITVKGSFKLFDICDKEFYKMAQTFGTIAKYGGPKEGAEHYMTSTASRPPSDKVTDNTPDAKKIGISILVPLGR
jgi:hypothetical protein